MQLFDSYFNVLYSIQYRTNVHCSDEVVDLWCSVDRSTKFRDYMSSTPLCASLGTSLQRRMSSLSALPKIFRQLFSIYCKVHQMKRSALAPA